MIYTYKLYVQRKTSIIEVVNVEVIFSDMGTLAISFCSSNTRHEPIRATSSCCTPTPIHTMSRHAAAYRCTTPTKRMHEKKKHLFCHWWSGQSVGALVVRSSIRAGRQFPSNDLRENKQEAEGRLASVRYEISIVHIYVRTDCSILTYQFLYGRRGDAARIGSSSTAYSGEWLVTACVPDKQNKTRSLSQSDSSNQWL